MLIFKENNYLCRLDDFGQSLSIGYKSFSSFNHSGSSGMVFYCRFFPGSLPFATRLNKKKESILRFPYTLAESACNVLTVTTGDLESFFIKRLIYASGDMQVKGRFRMRNANLS